MRNYKCYVFGGRGYYILNHRNASKAARAFGRGVVITNMHDVPVTGAVINEYGKASVINVAGIEIRTGTGFVRVWR